MYKFIAFTLFAAPGLLAGATQDPPAVVHEVELNAPVSAVWNIWTSGEGYKALGVAKAEVDLRIGGMIRSRYGATGELGDDETIHNEILAFEPGHMIAIRIARPPKSFPFKQAWKQTWTVITLTDLGNDRTRLRVASLGYGSDEESLAMRKFFEAGNAYTMRTLQKRFSPTPAPAAQGARQ